MSLKLFRRQKTYYIRGAIGGKNVYESTGFSRRSDADLALAVRSAEILNESLHGIAVSRTFAHAVVSYVESGGDPTRLQPLLEHFKETKLSAIGQREIDLAARKLKPKASPSTRNRQIYTPVIAVLNHAARNGWCAAPSVVRPKLPKGRVRWIRPREADRLIAAAAPYLAPLVIFLLTTGARLSEALYLDWHEVDLARTRVTFRNVEGGGAGTKNGETRGVPLHPRAVAALANLPHRTGPVFRKDLGGPLKRNRFRPLSEGYASRGGKGGGQVKTAWNAMLRRAGISNFTPHDARHTWATWYYAENHNLTALMELVGWKSVQMVMRYAHADTSHHAGSIDRIWAETGAKPVHANPKNSKNRINPVS